MKLFLLAGLALFCTASTVYRSKNVSVDDDGNVLITTPYGRRVFIQKQVGANGEKNIEISVSGPNVPTKVVQIQDSIGDEGAAGPWSTDVSLGEELRSKRGSTGKSQSEVLSQIVKEYQGVVDEAQYEKLLSKIDKAVKKGEVSPQIYDILEKLDQQTDTQQSLTDDKYAQGQIQRPYGLTRAPLVLPYQYQQLPVVPYYGTPRSINPLLAKILGIRQSSYLDDVSANQQLNGGLLTQSGYPLVYGLGSQNYLSTDFTGYQQVPYGQYRLVPQLYGQPVVGQYGIPLQTVGQTQIRTTPLAQQLQSLINQQQLKTIPLYASQTENTLGQPLLRGNLYRTPSIAVFPRDQIVY